MITVSKQENGVLFTFTNSDKYLYGSGTIEVPFNSLSIIQDESDNITLRKSASNDIFLSARYDTDFGYASKEAAVEALKEILYDEVGISEEEVQEMIDAATSGIPSSEVVEQLRRDVNAVSGEVNTKQDILTAGDNITISGNVISADAGNNIIELTQAEYDALETKDPEALYIITDAQEINMNDYYTKSEVDASINTKADASAVTAVNNALTAHTANTTVHVTQAEKNAWNGKVDTTTYESGQYATAQALNALQENKLDASAYTPTDLSEYWTSAQTQSAIDAATSGIPSSQVIEALRNDVNTVSGATENLNDRIDGLWTDIDEKEEVIASALTQLNQDVAEIDAKEEVIASALTEVRQNVAEKQDVLSAGTGIEISGNVISATGGEALFVNFDDLRENMNDEKWDELANALQNNKPIFNVTDFSEGDITADISLSPVDGYIYIDQTEGVEQSVITLNRLNSGGYNAVVINKYGSEDYEVTDENGGYQLIENIDDTLNSDSTNPVQNAVITQALDNKLDASAYTPTDLSDYWTSAQTQTAIDGVKAYFIDLDAIMTRGGLTDADWDGAIAAVNAHRPVYIKFYNDHFILESYSLTDNNNTMYLSASDGIAASRFTIIKNGSNDYSLDRAIRGFVTSAEKDAWNAKADASALTSIQSAVTAVSNDLNTLSGAVIDNEYTVSQAINELKSTKLDASAYTPTDLSQYWTSAQTQSAIDGVSNALTAHTANTTVHVTSAEKTAWNAKQDALSAGTGISISNNVISTSGVVMSQQVMQIIKLTQAQYDALSTKDAQTLYIVVD